MTIGITGPAPKFPGRSVLAGWVIAAIVVVIGLLLVNIAAEVLVDWLWFSSVGYLQVFWVSLLAEAFVFAAVFTVTAAALCLNGWLALHLGRPPSPAPGWTDPFALVRDRLPWPHIIAGGAGFIALLVAAGEANH